MNFPADLKYTKHDEWLKMIDDKIAIMGITDFAQQQLGDVVFVDITTIGKTLNAEEAFGTIDSHKASSDLFLPVSATILEANTSINDHPEVVNNDPYGEGWMVKIEILNPTELDALSDAEAYEKMVS